MITGQASPAGTQRFFSRHSHSQPNRLGRTEWMTSCVGFGGYRIDYQDPHHPDALRLALLSGCNLIDTSTNYSNGGSEILVGKVLHALIEEKQIQRDEVILVTKAGYIQGSNLLIAHQKKQQGKPFSDVTEYSADCWHSIAPDFLEDQITRSLERLDIATIDVLLLHNPEYFLKKTPDLSEYYVRIKKAFLHLEEECAQGRIQYYGVSSNTFPDAQDSDTFTSLAALIDIAQEIGPTNHFRVIQFPFNLVETGALTEPNGPHHSTLLELCQKEDIATLINRPLNAFLEHKLVRLALVGPLQPTTYEKLDQTFIQSCARCIDLEHELQLNEATPFGDWLRENANQFKNLHTWRSFLENRLLPAIAEADLPNNYQEAVLVMLRNFGARFEWIENQRTLQISAQLENISTHLQKGATLSQQIIQLYRSIPGVNSILVGMRHDEYVKDLLPPLPAIPAQEALEVLSEDWSEWISQLATV